MPPGGENWIVKKQRIPQGLWYDVISHSALRPGPINRLQTLSIHDSLKNFSIECRKTKTKVITTAQWELRKEIPWGTNENSKKKQVNRPCNYRERENLGDQDMIGFSFSSYWLAECCEFSGPITEQSKAKTLQAWITFDTQLKIVHFTVVCLVA